MQVRHVRGVTLPLFAAAVGSAAVLLFLVQPLFARLLLPHLGSSPVVWNTALVCYQAGLLAGYAYAYLSASHLRLRWQAVLHLTLLLGAATGPPPHAAPYARGAVCAAPGGLAGRDAGGIHRRPVRRRRRQQPILQSWLTASGRRGSSDPYLLYAVSNTGSIAALLAYPVLVEPALGLATQAQLWTWGYALLVLSAAPAPWPSGAAPRPRPRRVPEADHGRPLPRPGRSEVAGCSWRRCPRRCWSA